MEMIQVESSMIDSVGYEEATSRMVIVFTNGHVYEFHMVPKSVFDQFLQAESKGTFFMENLKFSQYGRRVNKLE
jgi:hypothetical protein